MDLSSEFALLFQFGIPWLSVQWNSLAGESYCLETAPDLAAGTWAPLQENIPGTGGTLEYFESPAENQPGVKFYRVVTTPATPPP